MTTDSHNKEALPEEVGSTPVKEDEPVPGTPKKKEILMTHDRSIAVPN
jgi:hypothetical protein